MKWLPAGLALVGVASTAWFGYAADTMPKLWTWQLVLVALAWLISIAVVWQFLQHLPLGEIDFDGENWYFSDQTTKTEHVGTVSVRLDVQNGMLLRFESEFKRVSWLWLDAGFKPDDWHDLRRAVYSRPAIQNSPDLI